MRNIIKEISIAKGIGIVLVVMGHRPYNGLVQSIIYSFHMPLFFLISGYLYNDKYNNLFEYVKKSAKTILLPYLYACVFYIIVYYVIGRHCGEDANDYREFNYALYAIIYGNYKALFFNGVLWFLPCLFINNILLCIILKYIKFKEVALVILCICGYTLKNMHLVFNIDIAFITVAFSYIGYKIKNIKINNTPIIAIIILYVIFFYINTTIDVANREYGNIIIFVMCGSLGSIIVLYLSCFLINTKLEKQFMALGENSMLIMTTHLFTFSVITGIFYFLLNIDPQKANADYKTLYIIIGCLAPVVLKNIFNKVLTTKYYKNYIIKKYR